MKKKHTLTRYAFFTNLARNACLQILTAATLALHCAMSDRLLQAAMKKHPHNPIMVDHVNRPITARHIPVEV